MKNSKVNLLDLPEYSCKKVESDENKLVFQVKVRGKSSKCKTCEEKCTKVYERKIRTVKHSFWNKRSTWLQIKQRRFKCKSCRVRFWERLPGILPYSRRTEVARKQIAKAALNGHDNKKVSQDYQVAQSTVQRDINRYTFLQNQEKSSAICPIILGIDEHFFTRKKGYATTLCDLKRNKVFDVVLGRSEKQLERFFNKLKHKDRCKVVCMDLSNGYRSIIKKHFPKAIIFADRFHVIRVLNHHFMELWKHLDPIKRKSQSLASLFRRKPVNLNHKQYVRLNSYLQSKPILKAAYDFRNEIHDFLSQKTLNRYQFRLAIKRFKQIQRELRASPFNQMQTLARTFSDWEEEILCMLRFTKNNGITEGFHNKMEVIARRAYGFRNFQNYRQRVLLQCA